MPHYIAFPDMGEGTILLEVEAVEVAPPAGVEKAGLRDRMRGVASPVATAQKTFDEAVQSGIDSVARAIEAAIARLDRMPEEVEVTFGLKATGEVGNVAIGKAGAEANLQVRLKWTHVASAAEGAS